MLRLVPVGVVGVVDVGVGVGVVGVGFGVVAVGPGVVGVAVGVVGLQDPSDTFRPVLAPAVWLTVLGTQLAPSSV